MIYPDVTYGYVMRVQMELTAEMARELLSYDPETGVLKWRTRCATKIRKSLVAGHVEKDGYRTLRIHSRNYRSHRVIWLMVHGHWPSGMIDHINRNPGDNRLCNLRDVTNSQNQMNKRPRKSSETGLKGVTAYHRRGRIDYRAGIYLSGKLKVIGYFKDPQSAHAAYCKAAKEIFGEYARTS